MILEGILMFIPFIVSICYKESLTNMLAFMIPSVLVVVIGSLLQFLKAKRNNLYQKEGFALVALTWIVMALIGAIPFVIKHRREIKEVRARIMKEPGGKEWLENFDKW